MRVLHLIKTATGATWAQRQIRELVQQGIKVHVTLPPHGPMVGTYNAVGAFEHLLQTDFPIRAPWRFPSLARKLEALVANLRPDIIHSHFVGTTLSMRLSLWRHFSPPRIFQVPGPLHLEHRLLRYGELATARQSDYWIGSCRWTCNRYKRSGIPPRRIFLSYYGTDIHHSLPDGPGKLRKELGLSPNCQIVGMVAFIYPPKRLLGQTEGLKGHEDLIDAFRICLSKTEKPDRVCVIVGGSWDRAGIYENKLRQYAQQQCGDRIIFLGTRADAIDLYADFDVAVHPSHSENVGGAVESLLMGVPTIATRVGGLPDLVIDGVTGWVVPPKDPASLASAIQEALKFKHEANNRAMAGQRLARSLFDVKKTSGEILSIYRRILCDHLNSLKQERFFSYQQQVDPQSNLGPKKWSERRFV